MGRGKYIYWCLVVIVWLCSTATCKDEPILGVHELASTIWTNGAAGSSNSGALDALDAMLVVLNSRKLHRRQVPSTCPYCPYNHPCTPGCPPAPQPAPTPCPNSCVNNVGVPGAPGPPGFQGQPGRVIFTGGGGGQACPGLQGPPGTCIRGSPGATGEPGAAGTCAKTNSPGFSLHALYSVFTSYYSCPPRRSNCPHSAYQLLDRLQRLEVQLFMLGALRGRLEEATDNLAALRVKYMENRKPGPRGLKGPPGFIGVKGIPGYDGMPGKCKVHPFPVPLPPGKPGKMGPKGEPGIQGDKICGCDGIRGDPGIFGPPTFGKMGPKGYKGAKGYPGTPSRKPVG